MNLFWQLVERLYPGKIGPYGFHPYVYQIFRSMIARSYRDFSLIFGMFDIMFAVNYNYGFNSEENK